MHRSYVLIILCFIFRASRRCILIEVSEDDDSTGTSNFFLNVGS